MFKRHYHKLDEEYKEKLCFVTFSDDDLMRIPKENFTQYRLSFCELMENKSISVFKIGERGIYFVTKTAKILEDKWYISEEPKMISSLEDDLIEGEDITENNAEEYSVTDLIDSITEEIHNYRSYDKNMIKNMLICITQGFLTVFAGEPGTGKTSLCDKIADILGVSQKDESNNRYLSISEKEDGRQKTIL